MLFMTSRAGRSSHLASQVRLLPPGPGWVWERAGLALGRDMARGPWAGPAEGVWTQIPTGQTPFSRTALPVRESSSSCPQEVLPHLAGLSSSFS